ncbi:MAG: hypothetical protein H8E37_01230 [Planctomycetes bacterium]|nr:hypothetical protein [Planctomycetota bacterium]
MLSGDTLATATVVNLQDDQADEITSEIGNEGHGNLDVDLYQVTLTGGGTFVVNGNEVSPRDQIQAVVNQLTTLVNSASSKSKLTKSASILSDTKLKAANLTDARDAAAAAVSALDSDKGPQAGTAFHALRKSVSALQSAVKYGEVGSDVAAGLSDGMTGAARNMAQNVHDYAESVGGGASKLESSQNHLDAGDSARAKGDFDNAINNYRNAEHNSQSAAQDVRKADPSQVLNSLIVTIRLFDEAGNELKEVHGQGGITLTWDVAKTGTYFVGISGNDNFEYDPNEEESGDEGSTGCYEMEMCMDMPPVITLLTAILVDPVNGTWEISGTVEDEDPESCLINFGGILAGHSTPVNADGAFSFFINLDKEQPGGEGPACAVAVDSLGQESDPWEFEIIEDC